MEELHRQVVISVVIHTPGGPEACNTCHGDFVNPLLIAPPRALNGAILPSERGVGAHTKHLSGNLIGKAVECSECHTLPNGFNDPIHIDQTPGAELVFGSFTTIYKLMCLVDLIINKV